MHAFLGWGLLAGCVVPSQATRKLEVRAHAFAAHRCWLHTLDSLRLGAGTKHTTARFCGSSGDTCDWISHRLQWRGNLGGRCRPPFFAFDPGREDELCRRVRILRAYRSFGDSPGYRKWLLARGATMVRAFRP